MIAKLQRSRRWLILAVTLAASITFALWWNHHKGDYFPKNFGVVEPGQIYRSGQLSPMLVKKTLANNNVKVVISLENNNPQKPFQKAELEACRDLGIEHLNFPLAGNGTGDVDRYVEAIAAMDAAVKEGKPVLVHCAAGAQRTGGVVAVYELLVRHKSPTDVRRQMLRYGWKPHEVVLINYVNAHMVELATKLVDRKIIDRVPEPLPQIPES